jgi:hypothetical protein
VTLYHEPATPATIVTTEFFESGGTGIRSPSLRT